MAAVQAQQPMRVEISQSRTLWLDRRSDRLERHQSALPTVCYAGGIAGYEEKAWAPGERFTQLHPGVDAERLGGGRHIADLLGAGLGRDRDWRSEQLGALSDGGR
jgi:hypothetical protein